MPAAVLPVEVLLAVGHLVEALRGQGPVVPAAQEPVVAAAAMEAAGETLELLPGEVVVLVVVLVVAAVPANQPKTLSSQPWRSSIVQT